MQGILYTIDLVTIYMFVIYFSDLTNEHEQQITRKGKKDNDINITTNASLLSKVGYVKLICV